MATDDTQKDQNPNENLFKAMMKLDVDGVKSALDEGAKASTPHRQPGYGQDESSVIANFVDSMRGSMMMRMGSNEFGEITDKHIKEFSEKFGEILQLLKDRGDLDVNATMKDGRTLLIASAEYAGTPPGDILMNFLVKNGADVGQRVKQQTYKWDNEQKKQVEAGEVDVDIMTSVLGARGGEMHMMMHRGGRPKPNHEAEKRARMIGALIKAGAPLDGYITKYDGSKTPVMQALMEEKYPVWTIKSVMEPLLERAEGNLSNIPHGELLLPKVLSLPVESSNYVREEDGLGQTDTILRYNQYTEITLGKLTQALIDAGANVNAPMASPVEICSSYNGPEVEIQKGDMLTPLELAAYNKHTDNLIDLSGEKANGKTRLEVLVENGAEMTDRLRSAPTRRFPADLGVSPELRELFETQQQDGPDTLSPTDARVIKTKGPNNKKHELGDE